MDIVKILHQVPLFSSLDTQLLGALTSLFEEESFSANSKILREGEFGDSMYIIVQGQVNVTKYNEEGKEILITRMMSGSYFGEVALIDNQPRSANINAEEDTKVLRLKKSSFEKLLVEDKAFAINFYRNCLNETLTRMRETATNLTSSKTVLFQKSTRLDQLHADLSDAKMIQDYFISRDQLSSRCIEKHNIKQTHIYKPYLEVGGDFLNLKSISEDKVGFIISDVMGHGISAALATGVLRSGFTIFSKEYGDEPVRLMEKLNEHIYEIFTSLYATGYYALLDMKASTVQLCKGGHMHPLIWKSDENKLLKIELPGPGLGIIPKARFEVHTVKVSPGDKMLFFTDGIIEQRNKEGEMFSHERLEQLYVKFCREKNESIVHSIYEEFKNFCNECDLQDDVTLFLLEF
jgi:sigma-B regulation protein RsbU (phosphoserine phosphatase)